MKTIGTLLLALVCSLTFAQHPLSSKKGANAKNYKAKNLKATTIQLFETPSDKYYAGANTKNHLAQDDAARYVPTGNNSYIRGKGANAKNKHLIIHKIKSKKEEMNEPQEPFFKNQISR